MYELCLKLLQIQDEPDDANVTSYIANDEIQTNWSEGGGGGRDGRQYEESDSSSQNGCNVVLVCNTTTDTIKPGSCQFT